MVQKMRLTLWISSLFLVIILGRIFLFIKFSLPFEIGTVASSDDSKIALVGIGNKGYSKIKLTEILLNTSETPTDVKLQVSNLIDGFTLADDNHSKIPEGISFKNIDEVYLKTGTSPSTNFEKSDEGTASQKDIIYGIYIVHNQTIAEVKITYKYFGMT